MYSLTMKRGKRSVFIGLFPSLYRLEVVECNLEWEPSWKPVIEQKEVNYAACTTSTTGPSKPRR
jgi:hypothetical protein